MKTCEGCNKYLILIANQQEPLLIQKSNMNYCFVKRAAPAIWSKIESQMQRGRQNAISNYLSQIWKILTMRRNSSADSPKHALSQKMYSLVVKNAQQKKFKMKTDWYGLVGLPQKEYAAMMKRRRKSSPMIFFLLQLVFALDSSVLRAPLRLIGCLQ